MSRQSETGREKRMLSGKIFQYILFFIALLVLLVLSFLACSPQTAQGETRAGSELIDYEWTVNENTWKNETELVLEANITIQNNATLYLSSSQMLVVPGNLSSLTIWIRDNASLVLDNSTMEQLGNSSSGGRGIPGTGRGDDGSGVALVLESTNAHLRIYDSTLRNTAIIGEESAADFVGCSIVHEGFDFSVWNNSELRSISSDFLTADEPLNMIQVGGDVLYLEARDENTSRTSAAFYSFSITNSTRFTTISSDFSSCLADDSAMIRLSQLLVVSFFDGTSRDPAGKGTGHLEIYRDGVLDENVSVLENETPTRTVVSLFSYQDHVRTAIRNITLVCRLLEGKGVAGYQEMRYLAGEFRELDVLEVLFFPELTLEQPRFYYRDREVSTIEPGEILEIEVTIHNTGTRDVRFDLYFYILFNVEKVFDDQRDVMLRHGEGRTFTGHWDPSGDDYPIQSWSLKVTVDNATPSEKNALDSEVSKTIRLVEDSGEEGPYFEIAVFGLSLLFLVFSLYILYLKRVEIFGDFAVDDVLLLDKGGRLVAHFSDKEHTFDRTVVGSMLKAIQDFVNVSFHEKESERLKSLKHGDKMILVEYGELASLAVVIEGTPSGDLRHEMQKLIFRIHAIYGEAILSWDGDITRFPDIRLMLENLAAKKFGISYELTKFMHFVKDELSRTPGGKEKP